MFARTFILIHDDFGSVTQQQIRPDSIEKPYLTETQHMNAQSHVSRYVKTYNTTSNV